MGWRVWGILWMAWMAAAGVRGGARAEENWATLDGNEREVFMAALKQCSQAGAASNVLYVVEETTSLRALYPDTNYEGFGSWLRAAAEERNNEGIRLAVEDLLAKNDRQVKLVPVPEWKGVVQLLTDQNKELIFSVKRTSGQGGWDLFYRSLPKAAGILTVSLPGISPDGTTAIIYVGQRDRKLRGVGRLWLFRKVDGQWVRQRESIGPSFS
jgi:hypothetical protein